MKGDQDMVSPDLSVRQWREINGISDDIVVHLDVTGADSFICCGNNYPFDPGIDAETF